MYLKNSRRK